MFLFFICPSSTQKPPPPNSYIEKTLEGHLPLLLENLKFRLWSASRPGRYNWSSHGIDRVAAELVWTI